MMSGEAKDGFDGEVFFGEEKRLVAKIIEELAQGVPGFARFVSFAETVRSVSDFLLCKKLKRFLIALEDVEPRERQKMLDRLSESEEERSRVAEMVIMIVDACEDGDEAECVGKLFRAYVEGKISRQEFLDMQRAVRAVGITTLNWYLGSSDDSVRADEARGSFATSLWNVEPISVFTHTVDDEFAEDPVAAYAGIRQGGGSLRVRKSELGKKMTVILLAYGRK